MVARELILDYDSTIRRALNYTSNGSNHHHTRFLSVQTKVLLLEMVYRNALRVYKVKGYNRVVNQDYNDGTEFYL